MKPKSTTKTIRKARGSRLSKREIKTANKTQPRHNGRTPAVAVTATSSQRTAMSERRSSKKAMIEELVRRKGGAAIADLVAASGWQAHSVRAALTGLRKAGHQVAREQDGRGVTCYRITGAA